MVNSNANALGILFPNSYDSLVPDLVSERLMASIPFASRYRLVDFILSSMVNCGIDNISLIVRRNYHSLMDHLGSGREWDLTRKNGGLNLVPPFAEKTVSIYNGRVEALASILDFLKEQKEKYVVMADTNLAVNFDFNALIEAHMESGADVTVAYRKEPLPVGFTAAISMMPLMPTTDRLIRRFARSPSSLAISTESYISLGISFQRHRSSSPLRVSLTSLVVLSKSRSSSSFSRDAIWRLSPCCDIYR